MFIFCLGEKQVGVLGELETESARVKKQELGAVSRGKELERELCAMESKVRSRSQQCVLGNNLLMKKWRM